MTMLAAQALNQIWMMMMLILTMKAVTARSESDDETRVVPMYLLFYHEASRAGPCPARPFRSPPRPELITKQGRGMFPDRAPSRC